MTIGEHNVGLKNLYKKKQKQQLRRSRKQSFLEKVYRGDIHVAVGALASKTCSFWCGFSEIHHHEILHCGYMYGCRCKDGDDINRCTISAGM